MAVVPPAGLDGVIVVDKPVGPTSHDVVALVRRLSGVKRVGHGGTLDPFASGVLPIFLGHATRVVEYHLGDEKGYRATVAFGARSTTDDLDGELTPTEGPAPSREALVEALGAFRGPIEQIPPAHSAVHVGGRRAYELAREGQAPDLAPRAVVIERLELLEWHDDADRPTAVLEVRCTAGTYVRALARDLGERMATSAYLVALQRTASGPFHLADAHPLEAVREALATGRAERVLLPPDVGLDRFPVLQLPADELAAVARGQVIRPRGGLGETAGGSGTLLRVVDGEGRLAAIARCEGRRLHPEKVFLSPAP